MSLLLLQKRVLKDKKYLMLTGTLAQMQSKLNTVKLQDEIETAHASRLARRLNPTSPKFADVLIRANCEDLGCRSRLAEIMMQCTRLSTSIEKALEAFKIHCAFKYPKTIAAFRTKGEREGALDACLSDMYEYIADINLVYALAEVAVKDIDQGGFALARNIKILELHTGPERRI